MPTLDPARFRPKTAYSWDPPEALRSGGRSGWPAILSSLKSVLETGKPLVIKLEPPKGMMELVSELAVAKPWLRTCPRIPAKAGIQTVARLGPRFREDERQR